MMGANYGRRKEDNGFKIDMFPKWLNIKHGEHTEATATRDEEHKCLGMKFTPGDSKFTADITRKVKETLEEFWMNFEDDKSGEVMTPASQDTFDKGTGKYLSAE